MDKRTEIMDGAVQFFSVKGFHQTSVQEIANAAGISKGAFYKHFDSKESMLIEILKHYLLEIVSVASNTSFPSEMGRKEVFKKKLLIEIERTLSDQEFFMMVFKDFPQSENEQLELLIKEMRSSTTALHKSLLLETYGTGIQDFLPDLVVILEALLREYIFTMLFDRIQLPLPQLVDFISACLDSIVENIGNMTPMISDAHLLPTSLAECFDMAESKIRSLDIQQDKLLSALHLLKEEVDREKQLSFVAEAMLLYLKQQSALKDDLTILENFIKKELAT